MDLPLDLWNERQLEGIMHTAGPVLVISAQRPRPSQFWSADPDFHTGLHSRSENPSRRDLGLHFSGQGGNVCRLGA